MLVFLWIAAAIGFLATAVSIIGAAVGGPVTFLVVPLWGLLAIVATCGVGVVSRLDALVKLKTETPSAVPPA
jgi:hypothetical protein